MSHPCRTSDPSQPTMPGTEAAADPAPAPALGEEEGHLGARPAPPFPAPRGPEPLSTSTPENISEKKSVPTKRKTGRPKGQPKTGGRKKPGPEPSGREARKYLEQNSGYLDLLCRMLRGKPIKRQGPTGKLVWYHPDFDDQKWALAQVLPRMIPTLASQEITGDKDNPLSINDNREPMSAVEVARRIAYLFDLADRESDETRRAAEAPRDGATAPAAGASCLSTPAAAPAPTTPEHAAQRGPASAGFSPDIAGTYSDTYGWIEGGPGTLEAGEANHAAAEPGPEPLKELEVGETAVIAGYRIECRDPLRDGTPPEYALRRPQDSVPSIFFTGWSAARKWVLTNAPDGADLTPRIEKSEPAIEPSRPEQRAPRYSPGPAVHGGYPHRKRF